MVAAAPARRYAGASADERRDERRARLLAAGLDALGTDGHRATTVRGVCARARLTPRYFYESFDDLDAARRRDRAAAGHVARRRPRRRPRRARRRPDRAVRRRRRGGGGAGEGAAGVNDPDPGYYFPPGRSLLRHVHRQRAVGLLYG